MARADLSGCRLYGIVDLNYVDASGVPTITEQLLTGGVDIVQLREKDRDAAEIEQLARQMHEQTRERDVPLIINDHPDIARATGAEGVHVGQDDVAVAAARSAIGNDRIAGKSTHSIAQAVAAAGEGADYIGFGPLFATPTKPDYEPIGLDDVAEVHRLVALPIFCIGGIKLQNLARVVAAGAQRVVIVSGLLRANDVAEYARQAKAMLP